MATSMEADSEVLFKEKREGKGVKTETAVDAPPSSSTSGHQRQPRRPRDEGRSTEVGPARNIEGSS